jgi:hypothetical protein
LKVLQSFGIEEGIVYKSLESCAQPMLDSLMADTGIVVYNPWVAKERLIGKQSPQVFRGQTPPSSIAQGTRNAWHPALRNSQFGTRTLDQ